MGERTCVGSPKTGNEISRKGTQRTQKRCHPEGEEHKIHKLFSLRPLRPFARVLPPRSQVQLGIERISFFTRDPFTLAAVINVPVSTKFAMGACQFSRVDPDPDEEKSVRCNDWLGWPLLDIGFESQERFADRIFFRNLR